MTRGSRGAYPIIVANQGLRAFTYGFGSVLLGAILAQEGVPAVQVGVLLAAMVVGMALVSILVGTFADRIGRRRMYSGLLLVMGGAGAVFAVTGSLPLLVIASLTGTIATDPNESGPLSSLEQVMIGRGPASGRTRRYGRYNAIAYLAGAVGALSAGLPALLGRSVPAAGPGRTWFVIIPAAAALAFVLSLGLGAEVEAIGPPPDAKRAGPISRPIAVMAGLFAVDSFGGGFVAQAFVAFWLERRFGIGVGVLGPVFFAGGLLQTGSALLAGPLAARIGLVGTMVFTQIAANLLIIGVAFAPALPLALGCLLFRYLLSQADIPARQAFVIGIVPPSEQTAAAAFTNSSRYMIRPLAPLLAGALMQVTLAAPFVASAGIKIFYDLAFYALFRRSHVEGDLAVTSSTSSDLGARS
ncbi:MAG: hypothetical protein NVS9B1_14800 [Candidatus Dormibacteraceae bacterium]